MQFGAVGFHVVAQVHAEIVQAEFVQRHGFVEVFQVQHLVFQAHELFVAVLQVLVNQFFKFCIGQHVVFIGGRNIHQCHARLHPIFEVDVFVQVWCGPEVDELDGVVRAANTVDTPKALDDAHRVPVDVVIDQQITVLQVLALRDAIGGDQYVNLTVLRHLGHLGALLGARCKVGQYLVELRRTKRGAVGTGTAGHQRNVAAQGGAGPGFQLLIQISGGVCKRAEHNDLAVGFTPVVGGVFGADLVFDDGFELSQLGIALRCNATSAFGQHG